MPSISLATEIDAPLEDVFDAAISVDLHRASAGDTDERVVNGVSQGTMALGDRVTWQARHFGIRWRMTVEITEYDRPHRFVDEMISGPFTSMRHVHTFSTQSTGSVLMRDEFVFRAPLGPLGMIAEAILLTRHLRNFLLHRNDHLKEVLESKS